MGTWCQCHPGCDGVGHLGGDVTMPQCQGQAHEVRGETAVVEAALPGRVETPATQQQVEGPLPVALGRLQPSRRERQDPAL